MDWYAHVTVATIVEDQGRFLLVEEHQNGQLVLNQPAGHLEPNESLIEAAYRETLEETGWTVDIQGVVGIGLYTSPRNGITYCRTAFHGKPLQHDPKRPLDTGIVRAVWMTLEELRAAQNRLRSPMVLSVVEQYVAGHRFPLSVIFN